MCAKYMHRINKFMRSNVEYIDVPGRPDKKVIAVWFPAPVPFTAPYTYDGRPYYKVENTTKPMPRDMFDERP